MILEAMYNGEFYPCETVVPTSPEYRKAVQTCAELMEQLSQRLSKEDYALVEELRAQNAIAQCEESESHFKYGFSAGLIVQQEAHEQLQNKEISDDRKSPRSRKERTGGVGFLCIWLFCQIIRSFRNQPVKVALIGPILQNSELFKLFFSKGFGNGGGHLAFIMQNIFLVEL